MSKSNEQQAFPHQQQCQNNEMLQGLPVNTSPYVNYKDMEEYKQKGYGTEGHQQVQQKKSASGSTDAPTLVEPHATNSCKAGRPSRN
ncbi:hypothetical protein Gotur_020857 [Gossypium turneri]